MPDEAGDERVVNTLGTGAAFGVSGFVSGEPRATSVRAVTDVTLFALSHAAFEATLERMTGSGRFPDPVDRMRTGEAEQPATTSGARGS